MTGSSHNRRRLASVDARILLVVLLSCGRDAGPATVGSGSGDAYRADVEKLCDVMTRSGAGSAEANNRTYLTATWLAANLTTQESRKFLVAIQPLAGEAKASALDAEAHRVGLAGCPLSAEWRKPAP